MGQKFLTNIYNVLLERLSLQDIRPSESVRIVNDVFNIMGADGNFTLISVNRELHRLGWQGLIIDETSFELILTLLEHKPELQAETHSIY